MKIVTLGKRTNLETEVVREARIFPNIHMYRIAERYSTSESFPLLLHRGEGFSYFSLFNVQGPFEIGDYIHRGFSKYDRRNKADKGLFVKSNYDLCINIDFVKNNTPFFEKITEIFELNSIPKKDGMYTVIYSSGERNKPKNEQLHNEYVLLQRLSHDGFATIITGEAVKKQLKKWGIDVKKIPDKLLEMK